jgi:hypothetical protein
MAETALRNSGIITEESVIGMYEDKFISYLDILGFKELASDLRNVATTRLQWNSSSS